MAIKVNELLQLMLKAGISDIHFKAGSTPLLRVHGELMATAFDPLNAAAVEEMALSLMNGEQKEKFKAEHELDMSYAIDGVSRFRVNAFRQRQRLSVSIRFISTKIPSMEDLRLPVATMKKVADNSRGLILVTGITGSGKSSTLASMIDYVNETRAEHIITIEDPIEFVHKDKKAIVSQREIGEDTSTYIDALRMAMRQDPDVILVGEMRDLETTSAAMTAAQTGHLVFGTLHTIDAITTISRIIDLYPPHQQAVIRLQLGESLKAVISQRLLPSTKGGRVPALEIMIVTAHIKKLIEENKPADMVQAVAKGQFYGMQTFNQSLVKLFKDGLVTEEEILDAATSPDDVKLAIRGIEQEVKTG